MSQMLSYISKTATKVYKASKKAIKPNKETYKQTQSYKLIRKLQKFNSEVLPTLQLSQLSALTYKVEEFYLIFDILVSHMLEYQYDMQTKSRQKEFRNTLIICAYLIKNGAGGFIDEFRQQLSLIQKISSRQSYPLFFSYNQNKKMATFVENNIMCRALYLLQLLRDKNKLIKEKQIAMLVKQKVKLKEKQKENESQNKNGAEDKQKEKDKEKVESFLENYIWKYVGILDDKLDKIADVLADQVEKYLLEEIPDSFQIDEVDDPEQSHVKTETDLSQKSMKEEQRFQIERQKVNFQQNLIQF